MTRKPIDFYKNLDISDLPALRIHLATLCRQNDPTHTVLAEVLRADIPEMPAAVRDVLFELAHIPRPKATPAAASSTGTVPIARVHPDLFDTLTRYAQHESHVLRGLARASLYGQPWNRTTRSWLINHIQHKDPVVRTIAATVAAVYALRGFNVRTIIRDALKNETDPTALQALENALFNAAKDPFKTLWTPSKKPHPLEENQPSEQPEHPLYIPPHRPEHDPCFLWKKASCMPLYDVRVYINLLRGYLNVWHRSFLKQTTSYLPELWPRLLLSLLQFTIKTSPEDLIARRADVFALKPNEYGYSLLYETHGQTPTSTKDPWYSIHPHIFAHTKGDILNMSLSFMSPENRDVALPLLQSKRAADREHALLFFFRHPSPEDVPILEAALERERAKKPRATLEKLLKQHATPSYQIHETYTPDEPLDLPTALSTLRTLLHGDDIARVWAQICDVIQRTEFHDIDPAPLCDYIQGHKDRLPALRPIPNPQTSATWKLPHVKALGVAMDRYRFHQKTSKGNQKLPDILDLPPRTTWVPTLYPISLLFHTDAKPTIQNTIRGYERGHRARLFDINLLDTFREAVLQGWAWCHEQNISAIDHLEVRVDSGVKRPVAGREANTTRIELWKGFGVLVMRGSATYRTLVAPGGLRHVQIALPKDHDMRKIYNLSKREPALDLKPFLNL